MRRGRRLNTPTEVVDHGYAWDSLNRLVQRNDNVGDAATGAVTDSYAYDSIGRLQGFRADLKAALIPSKCDELEFLPINVAGERWLLMNCLKTVRQFDEAKSQVLRGLNGDIFMVVNLRVTDPIARDCEIFTLAESNLAGGIDPTTVEVLADDSPLGNPHVIRALFLAAKALELMGNKAERSQAASPSNAGKAWTDDEDQRLVAAFVAGTPVAAIARAHERTSGAITSRLIRLGRLQVGNKNPPG